MMNESHEPIVIHPYSKEWAREFVEIGSAIRKALGGTARRIDHIGSTSVPGLGAKPIIDIQVAVDSLEPMKPFLAPLEKLGYTWRSNNDEKTKRYFRETGQMRRTHIHVRKLGSWHEQFALLFRDYLCRHGQDCEYYEGVKRRLAVDFRTDREGYTDSKQGVVWEIMLRADRWAAHAGWEPGTSDL